MKSKLGKFLIGVASITAIAGGTFYLVKKYIDKKDNENEDDIFEDDFEIEEDEFEDIFSDDNKDEREYVTINITDDDKKVDEAEKSEEE